MGEGRRKLAASVALALAAAACTSGGGGGGKATSSSTAVSTSITAGVTTTTLDPTKAAILAAYRASWADYIAVAHNFPVKPLDPRLAQHDTGKRTTSVISKALTQLNLMGHYNVGTTDLAPVVTFGKLVTRLLLWTVCLTIHLKSMPEQRSLSSNLTSGIHSIISNDTESMVSGCVRFDDPKIGKDGGRMLTRQSVDISCCRLCALVRSCYCCRGPAIAETIPVNGNALPLPSGNGTDQTAQSGSGSPGQ